MHQAKKRFGQNFLIDQNIIERIIKAIQPKAADHLIEIGPGLAALTKPLLAANLSVSVIEIDRDLIQSLEGLKQSYPQLSIYHLDALTFDFTAQGINYWRVFGNLPYNISSPLLLHIFSKIEGVVDAHFMLQKEVVDRLSAKPNTKEYGRLSIITQYYCDVQKLFDVPPGCFNPAPKVTSAVVRLVPKKEKPLKNTVALEKITQCAFGQRRKTLGNSLKTLFSAQELLALGIDPMRRAETLSLDEFCKLAKTRET